MATPSSGGDSDKAIPQLLPPPSLKESCACLQQEDVVDQSPCSASDSAWLQQLLQLEDIVDQSPSASDLALFPDSTWYASDMSEPTDFSGATSSTGATFINSATSFSGATSFNCATSSGARHYENYGTTLGYDEAEEVGTRSGGRGEGEMEEGHLNSAGCLFKGKRKVRSPRGERGNKKTTGARIEISLDDMLQVEQMRLREAARHLKVSASTLKRVCRDHGIPRWPPRMGKNCINQSGPSESLLAVDQEGIAQQRPDTPRSETPSSSNTNSVIIKARYVNDCTIKFRLSRPWVMVKLEQQVQKRLKLEAGTYYIKYKDEDNDLIIIACDEDLQDYISSSRPQGTTSIEVLLVPK